jgi:hypothetical protein
LHPTEQGGALALLDSFKPKRSEHTIARTGPGLLTQTLAKLADEEHTQINASVTTDAALLTPRVTGGIVILPVDVFYPVPNDAITLSLLASAEGYITAKAQYITSRTLAVHQWARSWQK